MLLALALLLANLGSADDWPTCDNRAFRDDELEPGGLKLLGVKESPLGYFPTARAVATLEHFFQQLREVLSDDCPNWSSASLWLRYFNHSGMVLAVDPVEAYLQHWTESLKEPWSSKASLQVRPLRASLGPRSAEEAQVFFDTKGGKIPAAEEVTERCRASGPTMENPAHPCYRIRRQTDLAVTARTRTLDDIWKEVLSRRHIDLLHVNVGIASMADVLERGFAKVLSSRSVTVFVLRVDDVWTKSELHKIVKILDAHEYFSMLGLLCENSSQFGAFQYRGPESVGPTTYLPLSSMDIDLVLDWDAMPLPQNLLAFDLQQPDVFKTVQLGDLQCDAEDDDGTCQEGDDGCRGDALIGPPERPQLLHVTKSGSRSITLEWRPHPEGPTPDSYLLRVDPGALEEVLDHDTFDALTSVQTYTVNGLRPNVEYTVGLRAMGFGGESGKVTLTHRTEPEDDTAEDSLYDILESTHCGMGAAEEVQPAGPAPGGASYFPGVDDVDGCRARCESNRQCVAFQVNSGNACWLYRRKPSERLGTRQSDLGWWCAVRRE